MPTILIVDDASDILDLVAINLERRDYDTLRASDGIEALKIAMAKRPDLIILDIMLPGMDGYKAFKRLRQDSRTHGIPVILLSAKGDQQDKIKGLELGVDDYVTKPFSPKELILRIGAVLRRSQRINAVSEIDAAPLHIDVKNHKVYADNESIDLTSTELKLLTVLAERRGVTQQRDDLLSEVWGYSDNIYTRTLDTHIKRLREKLGKHCDLVETVRGQGYRLRKEAQESGKKDPPAS